MTESFAQLFEESLKDLETRQGAVVKGTLVAIQKGFVLVLNPSLQFLPKNF